MIEAPGLTPGQTASWTGLLDLSDTYGTKGWTLIGGQLVHLHCWERGFSPNRATNDGDTVVDVRGAAGALRDLTAALVDIGFQPALPNDSGKQYRWTRDEAIIDVLVPTQTNTGVKANETVYGRQTIEAPGTQQALDRTTVVDIRIGDRVGHLPRPNLLGALIAKASAALDIPADPARQRHYEDFAVLAAMSARGDLRPSDLTRRDRQKLRAMITKMQDAPGSWSAVEGAHDGIARITAALDRRAPARDSSSD